MAKGQLRSNKEHKKPKQPKGVVTGPLSSASKAGKAPAPAPGKKK
jgi:hypothetical protein